MKSIEDHHWICPCCGEEQTGLIDSVSYQYPDNWMTGDEQTDPNGKMNEDFCIFDRGNGQMERYIRCILLLPIQEHERSFMFGVWISVSEDSWEIYRDGFESGQYSEDWCHGFLGNEIGPFPDSFILQCEVVFGEDNNRPEVFFYEADHDLVVAQANGISVGKVEEITAPLMSH